jgi:hypothetical protein
MHDALFECQPQCAARAVELRAFSDIRSGGTGTGSRGQYRRVI